MYQTELILDFFHQVFIMSFTHTFAGSNLYIFIFKHFHILLIFVSTFMKLSAKFISKSVLRF